MMRPMCDSLLSSDTAQANPLHRFLQRRWVGSSFCITPNVADRVNEPYCRDHPRRAPIGQGVDDLELGTFHLKGHHLGDPVTALDRDRCGRIQVDRDDLDLSAVARVDKPGRVEHTESLTRCAT